MTQPESPKDFPLRDPLRAPRRGFEITDGMILGWRDKDGGEWMVGQYADDDSWFTERAYSGYLTDVGIDA